MARVTIVIPNWNGAAELKRCLGTLENQVFKDFEVIIVDNGSTDKSADVVRSCPLPLRLLRLDRNYGFSRAVNQGIRAATSPYVVLLNNDTEQTENWLNELVKAMDNNPEYSIGASKSVFLTKRNIIDTAGDGMTLYGMGYAIGNGRPADDFTLPKEVFGASAGSAIYRSELFEQIGLFDDRFFAYAEDLDLCYRARLRGLRCLFIPEAVVYHDQGSTSRKKPGMAEYYTTRNILIMQVKNIPAALFWPNLHKIFLGQIAWLLSGRNRQRMWWVMRGWLAFIPLLPYALRKRRVIQRDKVSTKDLLAHIDPCFPFDSKIIRLFKKARLVNC